MSGSREARFEALLYFLLHFNKPSSIAHLSKKHIDRVLSDESSNPKGKLSSFIPVFGVLTDGYMTYDPIEEYGSGAEKLFRCLFQALSTDQGKWSNTFRKDVKSAISFLKRGPADNKFESVRSLEITDENRLLLIGLLRKAMVAVDNGERASQRTRFRRSLLDKNISYGHCSHGPIGTKFYSFVTADYLTPSWSDSDVSSDNESDGELPGKEERVLTPLPPLGGFDSDSDGDLGEEETKASEHDQLPVIVTPPVRRSASPVFLQVDIAAGDNESDGELPGKEETNASEHDKLSEIVTPPVRRSASPILLLKDIEPRLLLTEGEKSDLLSEAARLSAISEEQDRRLARISGKNDRIGKRVDRMISEKERVQMALEESGQKLAENAVRIEAYLKRRASLVSFFASMSSAPTSNSSTPFAP